jgi:hypothetical protein
VFRYHQVTHRAEAHRAAERRTLDAGDDRDGAGVDAIEHLGRLHRVLLVCFAVELERRAHPVHVRAGGEARTRARQDYDSEPVGRLAREASEGPHQLMDQRGVERVVDFGAVERDPGDDPGRPRALHQQRIRHLRPIVRAHCGRPALTRRAIASRLGVLSRYIRKMPKRVSSIGAFSAAEIPNERTARVSSGSITPSSHSRAVE